MKKAIFPGSFDPMHEGHKSIYDKATKLFDEVIVFLTNNDEKDNQANFEIREKKIRKLLPEAKIIVASNLTTLIAKENDAFYIVRGLRTIEEVEYERFLAAVNKVLDAKIETILIFADSELKGVSSTHIKNLRKKYSI